ncbi:MAG TPA: VirB8/TrbF family protein [Acinetobacter johnsonii]|nr:VirB8/TrbF family protein [Acinetobacter johnsonii]
MFKKKLPKQTHNGDLPNPYLNAKKQWNFIMGETVASRTWWQFIGIISLLIALTAVGGAIYIGSLSKFVPYVVEVDKLGETAAIRRADAASPIDDRIVRTQLASFIKNTRTVTTDVAIQKDNVLSVYNMLSPKDAATKKIDEYFNGSESQNPFKRAEKEVVQVEIKNVLKQSDTTWQIDWIETVRGHDGAILVPATNMRAILTVYRVIPSTEEAILRNPAGILVKDFSWQPQI